MWHLRSHERWRDASSHSAPQTSTGPSCEPCAQAISRTEHARSVRQVLIRRLLLLVLGTCALTLGGHLLPIAALVTVAALAVACFALCLRSELKARRRLINELRNIPSANPLESSVAIRPFFTDFLCRFALTRMETIRTPKTPVRRRGGPTMWGASGALIR